jgi:hypothetical protein
MFGPALKAAQEASLVMGAGADSGGLADREDWEAQKAEENALFVQIQTQPEALTGVAAHHQPADQRVIRGSGDSRAHPTKSNSRDWIWKAIVTEAGDSAAQTTGSVGMSITANATK